MRTIKHIFLALMSLFALTASAATAFTPDEIGQVKFTSSDDDDKSSDYLDYTDESLLMNYDLLLNNLSIGTLFNNSFNNGGDGSVSISISTKKKVCDARLYYSVFYTTITVPANTKRVVTYSFNGTIAKQADHSGGVYTTLELFDFGENITSEQETALHQNMTFHYSTNGGNASSQTIARVSNGNTSKNISTSVTVTYDNRGNNDEKQYKHYWGIIAASQTSFPYIYFAGEGTFTFSANVTQSFSYVDYNEQGYDDDGGYEVPQSENGYYLIRNEGNLYWFAYQVNNGNTAIKAKLMNDIQIADQTILDARLEPIAGTYRGWQPIGNASYPFKGEFLGQGHTISGIVVSPETPTDYAGLFGYADKCTIENIRLVNSYIHGKNNVGGIVGYVKVNTQNSSSTIRNCVSEAFVIGKSYVGGIAGYLYGYANGQNYRIKLQNCSCLGQVYGSNNNVGGVAGYFYNVNATSISYSGQMLYYKENVSDYYGAVWGGCGGNTTITNAAYYEDCGDISAYGIRGNANYSFTGMTYDADGKISVASSSIDTNKNVVTILNDYANSQNNYKEWELVESDADLMYIFKRGTAIHPYEIEFKEDLEELAENVSNGKDYQYQYFKVINNIDETIDFSIGDNTNAFAGNFDGNGYKFNLDIESDGSSYIGLFGNTKNAEIRNVVVTGKVNGDYAIGGIVGYADNTRILNCSNLADITALLNSGGIAGVVYSNSTIKYCSNAGKVDSLAEEKNTQYQGGAIAGIIQGSSIDSCFWYEKSAKDAIGMNFGNSATLSNVKSYKFNNGKLVINNPSGNSDLIQVLSGYAEDNYLKDWKTFIGESEDNTMFAFDFWPVQISQYQWSSLCLPFNTKITSNNGTAYYAISNTNKDNIEKFEANVIPAGEGVLVHGDAGANIIFKYTEDEEDNITNNDVIGTLEEGGETFGPIDGYKYYMLSVSNGVFGLYWDKKTKDDPTLNEGKATTCQQYKAVLRVNEGQAKAKSFFSLDDDFELIDTNIEFAETSQKENAKTIHNLAGQTVGKGYKGIVIINGKKFLK